MESSAQNGQPRIWVVSALILAMILVSFGSVGTARADSSVEDLLNDLTETVENLDIPKGLRNSLSAKLAAAAASLDVGDPDDASAQLQAFVNQVAAQSGKKLTRSEATDLTQSAEHVIDVINEAPPPEEDLWLAVAYTNVDGEPGFNEAAGDILISGLVDTNGDGIPSIGDTVETNQYPKDFAGTQFGSFGVTSHPVTELFPGAGEFAVLSGGINRFFIWNEIPELEVYSEYDRTDPFNTYTEFIDAFSATTIFGESITVKMTSPSMPDANVAIFRDPQASNDSFLEVDFMIP